MKIVDGRQRNNAMGRRRKEAEKAKVRRSHAHVTTPNCPIPVVRTSPVRQNSAKTEWWEGRIESKMSKQAKAMLKPSIEKKVVVFCE